MTEPVATEPVVTDVEPTPVDDMGVAIVPEQTVGGATLTEIAGIDAALADRLQAAGIYTVADVARSTPEELAAATGIPAEQIAAEDWTGQANRLA